MSNMTKAELEAELRQAQDKICYYARCGAFCCVVGGMPCKLYPCAARSGVRQAVRRCCR